MGSAGPYTTLLLYVQHVQSPWLRIGRTDWFYDAERGDGTGVKAKRFHCGECGVCVCVCVCVIFPALYSGDWMSWKWLWLWCLGY